MKRKLSSAKETMARVVIPVNPNSDAAFIHIQKTLVMHLSAYKNWDPPWDRQEFDTYIIQFAHRHYPDSFRRRGQLILAGQNYLNEIENAE